MNSIEQDLEEALAFHGHICVGQILGVRMAHLAMQILGIEEPKKYRDLVVCVEADRCLADAIMVATKCTMGRKRFKFMDYGKMAATFIDLAKNKAIRIGPKITPVQPPEGADKIEFWKNIPLEDVFSIQEVQVDFSPGELPGGALKTVICEKCVQKVHDGKQIIENGAVLCRPCARGAYYNVL